MKTIICKITVKVLHLLRNISTARFCIYVCVCFLVILVILDFRCSDQALQRIQARERPVFYFCTISAILIADGCVSCGDFNLRNFYNLGEENKNILFGILAFLVMVILGELFNKMDYFSHPFINLFTYLFEGNSYFCDFNWRIEKSKIIFSYNSENNKKLINYIYNQKHK